MSEDAVLNAGGCDPPTFATPDDKDPGIFSPSSETTTVTTNEVAGGTTIGAYAQLQLIGKGGMGEVWLAEQRQPVRRRVALKLIRLGMDTREVVARFESERQALALMDHPTIAKIFDAGSTSQGRPYFAMEYVPGLPITAFCDKHKLTVRERLQLFVRVCEGVQHAHQKAVIHRDLKPSNILVTEVDGRPLPKIIDFGVAKAVGQRLSSETLFTRAGAMVGTPEYMSPEQAESSEDIDTRTDVYSLGLVLYEVLVGALPWDHRTLALEVILRKIREDDAPRPSIRVRALGEQSTCSARNRRVEPRTLTRELRGDLDSITLKSIEKERARRYGSATELAADLERYLRQEPIAAGSANIGYRAKKYVARHRFGLAVAFVFCALTVAFAITEAVQLGRIERERDRSDRVAEFMRDMFLVSSPLRATRGTNIPADEILDKALRDIDLQLNNDPQLQARLLQTLGVIYGSLGWRSRGEQLLERAIAIQRKQLGPYDRETLRSSAALGRFLQNPAAEKLLRETLDTQRRVLGRNDPDTAISLRTLASILARQKRYSDAEKLNREALLLSERVFAPDDRHVWMARWPLFQLLKFEGKKAEAEELGQQSLDGALGLFGREDVRTLDCERELAELLLKDEKYSQAEIVARQAAEIERRLRGTVAGQFAGFDILVAALARGGKYTEANELSQELLERKRRAFGENNPEVAGSMYNLGCFAALKGRRDEAFSWLKQSVDRGLPLDLDMTKDTDLQSLWQDQRFVALQEYIHSHGPHK